MAVELSRLLPALNKISDPLLRNKVEKCWQTAITQGGWTDVTVEKIPFTLTLKELPDISLIEHTNAVTECSIALGEILISSYGALIPLNMDTLIAGALLHDVGKLLEIGYDGKNYFVTEDGRMRRHPISGCALAAETGLPVAVQHIIATHSWEGDKGHRSAEGYIVHHSDFVNYHPLKDR